MIGRWATRAKSAREGSDAEESESGDLSGTSSEKQRLFDTRAELRKAKQESLRLAGEIAEDDEADDDDGDDDDDDTHTKEEGLVVLVPSVAPIPRVLDAASALFTANSLTGRSASCVSGRMMLLQPMSVRLLLLLPRPTLVMRWASTKLLSMTWRLPLKTSSSSGRSLRPNVKPILIVQTPTPTPPSLALRTWTIRTRTDPYILMVFAMLK